MSLGFRSLRLVRLSGLSYSRGFRISAMSSQQRLKDASNLLQNLRRELEELKRLKTEERVKFFEKDNEQLRSLIQSTVRELVRLETLNGKRQIPIPNQTAENVVLQVESAPTTTVEKAPKEPKAKKPKPAAAEKQAAPADEAPIDVGRLDFRVGRIVEVDKHPDADSLYVEKVDCGEPNPRTVVSGLVKHIPIEEMRNRLVVLLCNLKPAKMRGITSEAMVMCASSPDKVEILSPPAGAAPGDLVHCEGYQRNPDGQLNPKKKIFETCAPDLMTNAQKEACYKSTPLFVPGKGTIVSQTLTQVNVK